MRGLSILLTCFTLLAASAGLVGSKGQVKANPLAGAETVASLTDGPWLAKVSRLADGTLNGFAIRPDVNSQAYLACRDKDWSIGFVNAPRQKWDRLVAWVKQGGFVDESLDDLAYKAPLVVYHPVEFLVGRTDWVIDDLQIESAPSIVIWIGIKYVLFQFGLGPQHSPAFVAALRDGGVLSVRLRDDAPEPWLAEEVAPLKNVIAFFIKNGCGSLLP